jgi:O-antigen ligase
MHNLSAIVLLLAWLMPLHFLPWVSWHSEMLAFFAVFISAWAMLIRFAQNGRSNTFKVPFLIVPCLILALIAFIQGATGHIAFWGDALVIALYLVLCAICLVLGFATNGQTAVSGAAIDYGNRAVTLLAYTLTLGAFLSAVVEFSQVFELWEEFTLINRMPQLRRPGGNLGQPNHLATLLLMGIASLLYLSELGKLKALPSALILMVLCMALAVTESRTGALSLLLLSGWWFLKKKKVGFKLSPWINALTVICFLGFFWAWPSFFAFVQQITGRSLAINIDAGSRFVVWPQLLEALAQRPWWGWGLGRVSEAHNTVAHAYAVSEPFSYSHNILLDLALGIGIPLTILLMLVTGVWLWRRVRLSNQLLSWYCLALALPMAVHSMLEFPFAYAYFLVPVMFALGALEGIVRNKSVLRIGVRPAAAVLLGVSIVAAWSAVEYFAIEEDFRIARFEALRVGKTPIEYRRPKIVLLTQLDALLDGVRISPKPDMTAEELELAKKVALRYAWTATQNRYALSLALNGNPEEAVRQLRVMRALHGERTYKEIKANWNALAQDKYPQLRGLTLP